MSEAGQQIPSKNGWWTPTVAVAIIVGLISAGLGMTALGVTSLKTYVDAQDNAIKNVSNTRLDEIKERLIQLQVEMRDLRKDLKR